jgi:hypothetical protein
MTILIGSDSGNYDMKLASERGKQLHKTFFRHALAPLSDAQWGRATNMGQRVPDEGSYLVNGHAFAVGDTALRVAFKPHLRGASRYRREYIGVLTAVGVYKHLGKEGDFDVDVIVSYPPVDYIYNSQLMQAVSGEWEVFGSHGFARINITAKLALDEPVGGFAHFALNADGSPSKRTRIQNETVLAIDVGGYSTDSLPIDKGLQPDYTGAFSSRMGTLKLMETFENAVRLRYRDAFQNAGDVMPARWENALMTGKFVYGNSPLDVADEVRETLTAMANELDTIITRAGGSVNYNRFLLTGGGSVLLYDLVKAGYPEVEVTLTDTNRNEVRFANVKGYLRMHNLMKKAKLF